MRPTPKHLPSLGSHTTIPAALLLTLTLAAQDERAPRPAEYRVQALMFTQIQEEWVHEVIRPNRLQHILPPKEAKLVARLGCEHCDCREAAAEDLIAMGDDAARALIWGRWATDPEVRDWSERLWARLFKCPDCNGEGYKMVKFSGQRDEDAFETSCFRCGRSGDLRYDEPWSNGDDAHPYLERDIGKALTWEGTNRE